MSSEQSLPTSDLRKPAQDSRRAAERKHKWALGSVAGQGRAESKPRPHRPSETNYSINRRYTKAALASLDRDDKSARRRDIADGEEYATTFASSDESAVSGDEGADSATSPAPDAGVMYSFDASRGPNHGSQILNVALDKAIEKYEEKETDKLVRNEYEVLDSEGESLGLTPAKKGKSKEKTVVVVEDEDYEFV